MSKNIHIWLKDDYKQQNIEPYHTYDGTKLVLKNAIFILLQKENPTGLPWG